MSVSIIAAFSKNGVIGKNNRMAWHLPADLKYFKDKTSNHVVIMGRKTFESIGSKPLTNRFNIIITKDISFKPDGVVVAHSIEEAIEVGKKYSEIHSLSEELFIVGGAQIYEQALEFADKLYLTKVNTIIDGDSYFPRIDNSKWEVCFSEKFNSDEKNKFDYSFNEYIKVTYSEKKIFHRPSFGASAFSNRVYAFHSPIIES